MCGTGVSACSSGWLSCPHGCAAHSANGSPETAVVAGDLWQLGFEAHPAVPVKPQHWRVDAAAQVLMHAGREGYKLADIVEQAAAVGVGDWRADKGKRGYISSVMSKEPAFVNVGKRYALHAFPGVAEAGAAFGAAAAAAESAAMSRTAVHPGLCSSADQSIGQVAFDAAVCSMLADVKWTAGRPRCGDSRRLQRRRSASRRQRPTQRRRLQRP